MFNFLKKITNLFGGTKHEREVAGYQSVVKQINGEFQKLEHLSHDDLRHRTTDFRLRIADHLAGIDEDIKNITAQAIATEDFIQKESLFKQSDKLKKERNKHLEDILRSILPEAFAVVKETARRFSQNETITVTATPHDRELAGRGKTYVTIDGDNAIWKNTWSAAGGQITWNMVHYDVQLIGGAVLHGGKIAEMATGEGKTLVSTLPAYLNGLSGEGVHIVTVNDYLARRDAEWNGPLFEFLLLTVDCIDKYRPNSPERREAYMRDIIYGTNNEFGFDYLRDNMVTSVDDMVQRRHHYAMVDEVDSVLIDDARTPLIISGPVATSTEELEYIAFNPKISKLIEAQKQLASQFLIEARRLFKENKVGIEEGQGGLALFRAHRALPKSRALIKFLSEDGVKVILQKTENYYMQENSRNMHIADKPLLFTIEEKNKQVELTEKGADLLARGTDDANFFIMPDISSDLVKIEANTTLSKQEKEEAKQHAAQEYATKANRLHVAQQLLKAYTLFEINEEYIIQEGEVKIVDEQTGRIMEGRRYSDGLHQALEAKENVQVGETTQTYATVTLQNYFRMYHKLAGMTGTAETEAGEFWEIYKLDVLTIPTNRPMTRKDVEDLVYKTEREKIGALIEEVSNLTSQGRPVLVGTTSVDDSEKLGRFLSMRGIKHNVLNAKQHQREAEIIAEAGHAGNVTIATNMAGRGTDIKINEAVKKAGGLAIIGTVRHESRRVDRQLRGRAGRQGDPGTTQFYVSLEDNLMRLFQSERIAGLMDKMGHKEGEMIQHSMVTKSIERAQKKVEENHFGTRKRLLEYDNVMNIQREAIYGKRRNALTGERLTMDIHEMFWGTTENLVAMHKGDYDGFVQDCALTLGMVPDVTAEQFKTLPPAQVIARFQAQIFDLYHRKEQGMIDLFLPGITDVYVHEGARYKRISIPFTDGRAAMLPVSAHIEEAVVTNGKSIMRDIEKTVTLALIDDAWKEHLQRMDDLKESVSGASFEQKDPLVIYKMEAYKLFEELIYTINRNVTSFLCRGGVPIREEVEPIREQPKQQLRTDNNIQTNRDQAAAQAAGEAVTPTQRHQTVARELPKVGRNELCPCGSGRKYKNCHGA
jgi:preprotein translocase subunit SecA